MIRPHKTIVNLFIVEIHKEGEYYFQQYKNTIDDIINKGGIVVSPSGNSGVELNKFTDQVIPCEFENVICVGGIETYNGAENEGDYIVDENSNYGSSVNFYSAYSIKSEILVNNEIKKLVDHGTSYSSPLVAGLIATLMSENSDIEYTFDTIIKQLNEYGASETFQIFNTVGVLANNGKHIVYSKDDVYYGCEVYAGNLSCSSDSVITTIANTITTSTTPTTSAIPTTTTTTTLNTTTTTTITTPIITTITSTTTTTNPPTTTTSIDPSNFDFTNIVTNTFESIQTTTSTFKKIPTSTVSGRCGPNYGACRRSDECCSMYGYCGKSSKYCKEGYQSEFGHCSSSYNTTKKKTTKKTTTTKKTKKISTSFVSGRCGSKYGKCSKSNECCSKYGYCGKSSDYCDNGCQPAYGICY